MNINALDSSLEDFAGKDREVSITLRDNSTVTGKIRSFDAYIILMADAPGTMVYRHSILKLTEKLPEQKAAPAPVKPAPSARPPVRSKRPERPARVPAQLNEAASDRPLGTMGEAMLKWLKSQQGK